jgi:hypothetical protein
VIYDDFKELLLVFNEHKVKYLVIGGYAFGLHAQPRATKDLDLFIRPDLDNARAAYTALGKFGAPLEGLTAEDLIEPGTFFHMGVAPYAMDIFPAIPGIDFDQAWSKRVQGTIDLQGGHTAPFISCEDLITAKLAAGRPRDLLDVDELREAEKVREELRQHEQSREQDASALRMSKDVEDEIRRRAQDIEAARRERDRER